MTERQLRDPTATRWDFLKGAMPNKRVNPTDIDLCYEHRGHLLYLEGKPPGGAVSVGQGILFDVLHDPPRSCVLVFEGYPPDDVHNYRWWGQDRSPADAGRIRRLVRLWWEQVDR